ncbi:MAG: hypothetical protein M3176_05890 [Chloroflexota bacterium]|nr:hypothetical protein [Chloroflexota bacterium]
MAERPPDWRPSQRPPHQPPPGQPTAPMPPATASGTEAMPTQPLALPTARRRWPSTGTIWSALAAVLFIAIVVATFAARRGHDSPILASTPDANVANDVLLAYPNPVPTVAGRGTTVISWIAPAGTIAQVWVSIDAAPETLFGQGPHGAQHAPWIEADKSYLFSLYLGTSHVGPPLRTVIVVRQR